MLQGNPIWGAQLIGQAHHAHRSEWKCHTRHFGAEALKKAKLAPRVFPTLGEVLDRKEERAKNDKREKKNQNSRQTYFCVSTSHFWQTPLFVILNELKKKHNMRFLRISMSYHKFSNVREIFQGDLTSKIMEGIQSRDFINRSCNCNKKTKVNGICPYNGKCRHSMVVYTLTCKECEQVYTS